MRYLTLFLFIVLLISYPIISLAQNVKTEEEPYESTSSEETTVPSISSTSTPPETTSSGINNDTYSSSSNVNNSNSYDSNSGSNFTDPKEHLSDWEKNQRVQAQQEARRKRKAREREKDNLLTAKRTLQAAADENCDWRTQPLAIIRGEVCGSYYKVLGLDRKRGIVDKGDIKKAYRQKSLNVHPDKNSSPEANEAFKVVQEAYECLSDDACRKSYDRQLSEVEENISQFREGMKRQLMSKALVALSHAHYYISVAAHHLYQTGLDLWDLAGEIEMSVFGQSRPIGKVVMALLLVWKGRMLLKLHAAAYLIVRVNYELAKSRGLL